MKCSILAWLWPVTGMLLLISLPALAEEAPAIPAADAVAEPADAAEELPAAKEAAAAEPAAQGDADDARKIPAARLPYRKLAPGVMHSVDPLRSFGQTVSRHSVVEILAVDPSLAWAKDNFFRRDIWTLDFEFKPVRMIWIDMPRSGGHMERKLIWYMVYSVTNPGKVYHPVEVDPKYETFDKKQLCEVKEVDQPVRFTPELCIEAYQRAAKDEITTKLYPDRVIPIAMAAIRDREDPNRPFRNSVEMCRDIKVGETVWGIATWEGIDPRTFKFSVLVSGLTNAYGWEDKPGEYKAGDPVLKGRQFTHRTLKLNFWRPGDQYAQNEEEIRYGVPGGVDYDWVYR